MTTEEMIGWMRVAYMQAANSHDPRTRNGSVLVSGDDNRLLAAGHNRILPAVFETTERLADRASKLKYITHAEAAAICTAAKCGLPTDGATLVSTWAACSDCAKLIVAAGVRAVIRHRHTAQNRPEWAASLAAGDELLHAAGVTVIDLYDRLGTTVLFDGELREV